MMKNALSTLLFALLLAAPAVAFANKLPTKGSLTDQARNDEVRNVDRDDPEMVRAFARARAGLDDFLAKWRAPPAGAESFSVKVGIAQGERREFFWLGLLSEDGDRFRGRIDNTPRLVTHVEAGQEWAFDRADIVDWTYQQDGRMQGNFTACALLTHESPAERAEFEREYGLVCAP